MIKYWCVAQGTVAGFIQYETPLKSWDHACGVLCVIESGGTSTDAFGKEVMILFTPNSGPWRPHASDPQPGAPSKMWH